jgi:hypothetical protein
MDKLPSAHAPARAPEAPIPKLLRQHINKLAHKLAENDYLAHRDRLTAEIERRLRNGETREELAKHLLTLGGS